MIESSEYMLDHHKQISGRNAIVDKQCVWPNWVMKKILKLDRFLASV